jgi:ABC-2 type transport system permease protein
MSTIVPKTSTVFSSLFRADITTQWRNRRGLFISLLIPVMMVIIYKSYVNKVGGAWVLAYSLNYGLIALGLMGYPNTIARDRDKGVFQRLRVAPIPTWAIMGSRLLVQLLMIVIITLAIFIIGYDVDHICLSMQGYIVALFTAILGAAVYLSIGQMVVALLKTPDTVNSTSRLIFLLFIVVGTIGAAYEKSGEMPQQFAQIYHWLPYTTINTVMAAGMNPGTWDAHVTNALLITLGYIVVFLAIGIKKFRWDVK